MKERRILLLVLCGLLILGGCGKKDKTEDTRETVSDNVTAEADNVEDTDADNKNKGQNTEDSKGTDSKDTEDGKNNKNMGILEQAELLAAGYDYDGAVSLLKGDPDFDKKEELKSAAAKFEAQKAACVPVDVDSVTHIFYHSLIVDTSKAFDGDYKEGDYNQVMTTVSEFNKITQQMYDKGYVLVRLRDLVKETKDENGNTKFVKNEILLPEGKKPFVLSIDDVSYYHYMDGDGYASRMVLDKNGKPKCEYVNDDGTVDVGDYDVVPLMDAFIEEHPDAAYKGARGMLALTGYNGVLGYRTDTAYKTGENLDEIQKKFLEANPDFDFDKEVEEAKKVADGVKAAGWEIVSHTWGHLHANGCTYEKLVEDTKKWKERVAPIVGDTDTIVFAFGEDIGDWRPYSEDNEKYKFLKSQGYNYFCNVDSSPAWVQITGDAVRQGRRNLDGYRMYYDLTGDNDKLSDLFDVKSVFDPARPTPVPPMG